VVAHAGARGRSAAGLALLDAGAASPEEGAPGAAGPNAPFVAGFLRPAPPLGCGTTANGAGATAMLDVSDGLLRDAGRIAAASGVSIDLDGSALGPFVAEVLPAAVALGGSAADALDRALTWVLGGGEDHGLLATFPPEVTLPAGFVPLGTVRGSDGNPQVTVDGAVPADARGWDHFRA
jgi:thiamine-monophosphate kinase